MIIGVESGRQSSNTKAVGLPLDKDKRALLWREKLSLSSDQLYMPGTVCLSYGDGYVLTAF